MICLNWNMPTKITQTITKTDAIYIYILQKHNKMTKAEAKKNENINKRQFYFINTITVYIYNADVIYFSLLSTVKIYYSLLQTVIK